MLNLAIDHRLFFALVIGTFMGALDLTILAPALPAIGNSFGVAPSAVVLAFSIYAAFYAASVPLLSKLADVRGYGKVYGVSMLLFAGGSALAALAPSLEVLVIARVVQGIGGGGLFPVAQALVGAALPDERRGKMLGILVGVFALGAVLGPNLGGLLVQEVSWPWIFWINVPLGLIGAALVARVELPAGRPHEAIDWKGALLIAVTFGAFVLGIEGLRHVQATGFFSLPVGGMFLIALVGALLLIPVERRSKEPVIDLRMASSASIAPLLGVSFLVGYALLGALVFAPLYAQVVFGASALGSGALLNAAAVGLGVASYVAGVYTNRLGARRLVIAGMALTAAGLALMILLQAHLWGLVIALVPLGAGLGLSQGPISYLALNLAPDEDHGQVSGLIAITRSMGAAAGITIAGVLLSYATRGLPARLPSSAEIWNGEGLGQAMQETAAHAVSAGLVDGWYAALAAALLGLVLSLFIKGARSDEEPLDAPRDGAARVDDGRQLVGVGEKRRE